MFKIEITKDKTGHYYWKLKARNGRILCHSESYSSLFAAQKTAQNLHDIFSGKKKVKSKIVEV